MALATAGFTARATNLLRYRNFNGKYRYPPRRRIRTDFPGWKGDSINAFNGHGLKQTQLEMQTTLAKLLHYRKGSQAIQKET